jgi:hypothetical protein
VHVPARWTEEYEIYRLFKDTSISKFTIKDCENYLPCVVKSKIAKSRVADNKKVQKVVAEHQKQRESVVTTCGQET